MSPARVLSVASIVGVAVGLLVELVAQPLLHYRDVEAMGAELPFPWMQIALAPLLSGALFGATAALAALPVSWTMRGRARALAPAVVALALALALFVHTLGLGVRYTSGLYPTPSSAELFLESPIQFLDQVADSYPDAMPWVALGLLVAWLSLALVFAIAVRRSMPLPTRRLVTVPVAAVAGAACLGSPTVSLALRDFAIETAETALYGSILEANAEQDGQPREDAGARLAGPPRSEGEAYMARLAARAREGTADLPNVLLVMLESVPQTAVGFGGYSARPVTPNLDRLAAKSLRMRRTWSTSTHSNYAQMAILSSLFPRRGARLDTYRDLSYPRALPQDLLRPLGYDTATFSSQNEDWQGMRRFQRTPTPHLFFDTRAYSGPKMGRTADSKVPDDATASAAIAWLERPRSGPFYLYLNLQQTHWSYRLPPGAQRAFDDTPTIGELRERGLELSFMRVSPEARAGVRAAFDDALRFADGQLGRVLRALERLGELENTLVVVTADHGESFGQAGIDTHGKSLREPEARPPLLLSYPRRIPAGDVEVPVSHLDVMPTVLDALGLPPYPGYQGASFLDARAFESERRAVFLTMQGLRHADGVVCFPWKLVHDRSARRRVLYHLGQDPHERRDLLAARPSVARRLEALLADQISAQLAYHARSKRGEETRFAPRIARCPELPRG